MVEYYNNSISYEPNSYDNVIMEMETQSKCNERKEFESLLEQIVNGVV